MDLPVVPSAMIELLRAWFFAKDRSIVMANDTFIEGDEISTPGNPVGGRRRLYAKDDCWYDLDSDGNETSLCGGAWELISETELTGSVASVTFSSIPQTYRTLVLVTASRTDRNSVGGDTIRFRFNGDTGSNYDWVFFSGRGSGVHDIQGARAVTSGLFSLNEALLSRANNFSPSMSFIMHYTNTSFEKNAISYFSQVTDVSADSDLYVGLTNVHWRNTAAITSITVFPSTGPNFVANSIFQLYGIL